jgi:predicted phage terminase large subunit-like protein
VQLTAELVESLSGVYLSPRYDTPQPTPEFHRECWTRYCSPAPACATAAPRNHAKSTALTHDYVLANVLFRAQTYIILVGSSEEMAIEHLNDIANELRENEDLIRDFKIKDFVTDQKTDIIVECIDGYQFRIIARGAEQKIRGRKWRGCRPGLIVGDDLEDDEQVENKDRRKKFRKWFFRACKQALRDGGFIRVHGTILHEDSLLNHLIKNKSWNSRLYKAHKSFSEFEDILWPEKFPAARLKAIRQEFINEGDSGGYSQEYLNDPADNDDRYLRESDLLEMKPEHFDSYMTFYAGVDFAISKKDSANRTSITVGGKDTANFTNIIDQRVDRWDSLEIVEELFSVESRWNPAQFFVEGGQIWKAIEPILIKEMLRRDKFINFTVLTPISDKKTRGRSFQKRTRAGAVRFNKLADWWDNYREEILRFTGDSEALLDDQFDSSATLFLGIEKAPEVEEDDSISESDLEFARQGDTLRVSSGRSLITGY